MLRQAIAYPSVAQLVGRLVWDQDAASSSLATRTMKSGCFHKKTTAFLTFMEILSPQIMCRWKCVGLSSDISGSNLHGKIHADVKKLGEITTFLCLCYDHI